MPRIAVLNILFLGECLRSCWQSWASCRMVGNGRFCAARAAGGEGCWETHPLFLCLQTFRGEAMLMARVGWRLVSSLGH